MSQQFNLHDANKHLSEIVECAGNGETFIIAKAGKPIVAIQPLQVPKQISYGKLKGKIQVADDFDASLSEEEMETPGS